MTKPPDLLIALSAGGRDDELAQVGIGMEHVNELMVRMARKSAKASAARSELLLNRSQNP